MQRGIASLARNVVKERRTRWVHRDWTEKARVGPRVVHEQKERNGAWRERNHDGRPRNRNKHRRRERMHGGVVGVNDLERECHVERVVWCRDET